MTPPPYPADEADRLASLRALLILDTPPEERFDRIVQFAAHEFDMPTVLLSLVDESRQWFKARVGMADCETGREVSFCAHALEAPRLLLIEDAWDDPRFADNPLVTGPSAIRFYAGAPLYLPPGGSALGTLCLIDTRPRRLDSVEQAILIALRDLAVEELRSRGEGGT